MVTNAYREVKLVSELTWAFQLHFSLLLVWECMCNH